MIAALALLGALVSAPLATEPTQVREDAALLVLNAEAGALEAVDRLLEAGVPPDAEGMDGETTALFAAASHDHSAIVVRLLRAGADPDRPIGHVRPLNAVHSGVSDCAASGVNETVAALLEGGADVDLGDTDDGTTPLMMTARYANLDTLQALLARGAQVPTRNAGGHSALAFAIANERCPSLRRIGVLLAAGARPGLREACGIVSLVQPYAAWPLTAACLALLIRDRRRPPVRQRPLPGRGDDLPALQPIRCARCGAPVPVVRGRPVCASCGSPAAIPADYEQVLSLRAEAAAAHLQAARSWRWATRLTAPALVSWLYGVGLLWGAATFIASSDRLGPPHYSWAVATGLVVPLACLGWAYWIQNAAGPLGALPSLRGLPGGAGTTGCPACGAPVAFEAGDLVATCAYCGGQLYRARLAGEAHVAAAEDERRIAESLHHVLATLRRRRRAPLLSVVGVAVAMLIVALRG